MELQLEADIPDAVRATRWIDIREYLGASGYNIEGNPQG